MEYVGIVQQQGVGVEILPYECIVEGVKRHITQFKQRNTVQPEIIIVYRDGLSDEDVEGVQKEEIVAIKETCHKTAQNTSYNPSIIQQLCIKRHAVRFWTNESKNVNNPIPGTVIDTHEIAHVKFPEFYLYTTKVAVGTASPTLYQILINETEYNMDDIQELTLHLCFSSQRVGHAHNVAVPSLYAHLMCSRTQLYSDMVGCKHISIHIVFNIIISFTVYRGQGNSP